MTDYNYQQESKTLKISFALVIVLMIWGLVFNELTESNIVELDAGAYIISGIIGLITIYVAKLSGKPKNEAHPLGYSGFIPVLNLIRSFMIILICLKAIGESLGSIFAGPQVTDHHILYLYAIVTLFCNSLGYLLTRRMSIKLNSALLKTDATEWKIDTLYNLSILLAISVSYGLQFTAYKTYVNYVDPVFCIVLSLYMCYFPVLLFMENVKLLSVSNADVKIQEQIVNSFALHHPEIHSFEPAFTVLHIAGTLWLNIELKIQADKPITPDQFSIIKATSEILLQQITPDYKLSFEFSIA